ncbi:aminoglycoside phosphotransferase [Gloeocapsa sp. PCC 7428]|uniref:phosphotransferase n=1 Tax=Gloeocapsa sp. PCC 7428 TaxID=1173026 RepID=UPI0002A61795|nr:phosphotransferase [Gloeocapsa sp. PCC 7428]AFZ29509.1 aminoglycoside phosphotransferase [Gloeocapsa sp. PCC 7428]
MTLNVVEGQPTVAAVLEQGLCEYFGQSVQIQQITSTALDNYSTHPIHRLQVTLNTGQQISTIFKRLRQDVRQGREVLLYQRLLVGQRFGAPQLYAGLCDRAAQRYWLFLEDVGEWKLEYYEISEWLLTFRWMAQLHAAYYDREAELRSLDCLGEHNAEFYYYLLQTARESLKKKAEAHLLMRFDCLMAQFDELVAFLICQPHTLLHGDVSCHNIIVQPNVGIRPIDWEWASIGIAAWDVVRLLSGWGKYKPYLLAAYLDELKQHIVLDRQTFSRTLVYCDILKTLWYLRWWIKPFQKPAFVETALAKLENLWYELD